MDEKLKRILRAVAYEATYADSSDDDYMCMFCRHWQGGAVEHWDDCPVLAARELLDDEEKEVARARD
jgi:hypothetical protein